MTEQKLINAAVLKESFLAGVINGWDTFPIEYICDVIDESETVDSVPVVHGRWNVNMCGYLVCSECHNIARSILTGCLVNRHYEQEKTKFCPNCGAIMDKKEGE